MLIELLVAGVVGKALYDVDQSVKMDEWALEDYSEAYEIEREARQRVNKIKEIADIRLQNVVKKKRAVQTYTLPRFVKVYGQIQKIEIQNEKKMLELYRKIDTNQIAKIESIDTFTKKEFTDQELLFGLATKGIAKMIRLDSERELAAAENQLNAAKILDEQSKSVYAVYEAIIEHADRISKLTANMNVLFMKSIEQTETTIDKNGVDVSNYTEHEIGTLMTCVNIAQAMLDILSIPVVDKKGKIYNESIKTIEVGEQYLDRMQTIMK